MNDRLLTQLLEKQTALLEQLTNKETMHEKHDTGATTGTGFYTTQPGGIFSVAGTSRNVFTAHIRPSGIASVLPLIPSNEDNPRYATITGITADDTSVEATNPCDPNPSAFMKGCYLTARFGRTARDTNVIEWDKVKRKVNRGVYDDLILNGRLLGLSGLTPQNMSEDEILNILTMAEMVTAVVSMERKLVPQMWVGSPAVNTAGGGYKEFPGLDLQIATGQIDAETGVACPALDSDVKDFAFDEVGGTGRNIVEYVQMMEFYLRHNASRMGLDPVEWIIVMRPELWDVLTEVWPCEYNTNRCASAVMGTSQVFIDGRENINQRDMMRRDMVIDIRGTEYRVVTDDGIFEHNANNNQNLLPGQYASSLYFVPLTVLGSFPVTRREYVDYRLGGDDVDLLRGTQIFWTDDGVYSWSVDGTRWCYTLAVKTEQRVVLQTPQLAGKIQSVMYQPLQHLRSFDPASPYHYDGGSSVRNVGSDWAIWLNSGRSAVSR